MDASELIQELQTKYVDDSPDIVKASLSGHSNVVQMNFVATYFPLEFIQNADDEGANSIRFQIREIDGDWCLEILNNGREFTDPEVNNSMDEKRVKKDVRGLCAAGQSPKEPRNHIGFIGVGFKSIFEISDYVEVHSGEFDFEFNRERAQNQSDDIAWRVVPFDSPATSKTKLPTTIDDVTYNTRFVIHLNERGKQFLHEPNESETDLFDPLDSTNLDRRVFLFLKNLQEISIYDEHSNTHRYIQRNQPTLENGPLGNAVSESRDSFPRDENQISISEVGGEDWNHIEVIEISEQLSDTNELEKDRWVVFKHLWEVPVEVSEDPKTEDYMRSDVRHREVFVAGLVDDKGSFQQPEDPEGTVHTGVFSYLPLKELETNFHFLVHADFLTPPDRQNIKRELLWNEKISEGVVDCLKDVLQMLSEHNDWWGEIGTFTPGKKGDEFIVENLIEPIHKYLRTNQLTRDSDEELVRLDDCRLVSAKVREAFSADELEQIGSSRPIHSYHEDVYEAVFPQADTLNMDNVFLDYSPRSVLEANNSSGQNKDRFQTIYEGLDSSTYSSRRRRSLNETGILLEDGDIVGKKDGDTIYFPPEELDLDKFDATPDPLSAIEEQLNIVDRTLATDDTSHSVLKNANVESLTTTTVISRWLNETDWSEISDPDRLLAARLYCEAHNSGDLNEDDIPLLLKSASGEWEPPSNLFMPVKYRPNDPVQKLQDFDWFNEETIRKFWAVFQAEGVAVPRGGPQFVSDDYIDLSESLGSEEWRELFYYLGVDEPFNDGEIDQNLIGCLGELYVHSQLDDPSETNIRNVYIGRDIVEENVSHDPDISSPSRIIEVKSTKDANKGFELTPPQTDVLEQYDDRYFVYRVTRVLEDPQIHVASADAVDTVANKKIKLNDAAWRSIAMPFQDHQQQQ